MFVHVYR